MVYIPVNNQDSEKKKKNVFPLNSDLEKVKWIRKNCKPVLCLAV